MKQKLQAKLKNRKGFTLVEMLIVVAIIAILVAVSIPLVTGALDKARDATDAANERAARAAATIEYLINDKNAGTYNYDAESGTFTQSTPTAYGQCDKHRGEYIQIQLSADGDINLYWSGDSAGKDVHGFEATQATEGD